MKEILETRDLCKYYGEGESMVRAIDHTSIQIKTGEFVAIEGKSGSGKSTLLHMLGGLDFPTSGNVLIGEKIFFFKGRRACSIPKKENRLCVSGI